MRSRITRRDVFFFLLGVLISAVISVLWEWNETRAEIRDGAEDEQPYEHNE